MALDETRLWRAVIVQAFVDAASGTGSATNGAPNSAADRALRNSARCWLTSYSSDLFEVCRQAGEDFEQVLATGRRLKTLGWPDTVTRHQRGHAIVRAKKQRRLNPGFSQAPHDTIFSNGFPKAALPGPVSKMAASV